MITITLTPADLARVRFSASALNQVVLGTRRPTRTEPGWTRARRDTWATRLDSRSADTMALLASSGAYLPDFLTPPPSPGGAGLGDELDAFMATPTWRMEADLELFNRGKPDRRIMGAFDNCGPGELRRFASDLAGLHRATFGDDWSDVERTVRREINRRSLQTGSAGLDAVLGSLHPRITWRNPTLILHTPFGGPNLTGNGRGVVLVPTPIWQETVATKINAWDPVVICYPIVQHSAPTRAALPRSAEDAEAQLRPLLGRTRAAVIAWIAGHDGASTSEVAQACGIAAASASEHTAVLRRSGLIATERDGKRAAHRLTALGRQMVEGPDPD